MKKFVAVMAILFSQVLGLQAFAQGALDRPHPRVSELQDKMTEYARNYLTTRLPEVPFLITVRVDPLRRAINPDYAVAKERLPYFDLDEEEVTDEWDDPKASLYTLQSRVQKVSVLVALPQSLKAEEAEEIKESMMSLLRLIPGRDEVRIERRSWSVGNSFWYYAGLSLALALFLLVGMLFVSKSWARKLAGAISEIKPKEKDNQESTSPISLSGLDAGQNLGRPSGAAGDLKFMDPLKTREFVTARVQELISAPHFPCLESMIEMDKLVQRSPKDLGALLMQFPKSKQEELFSLSYHTNWLDAFSNPGELGSDSLEILDKVSRIHGDGYQKDWDRLLIQIWRLGEDKVRFLKNLTKDEAFCILKKMPTSIAIPAGRLAFPGNWAALLDPQFEPKPISASRIKDIFSSALNERPLRDFSALEKYRQERDLLEYLSIAGTTEERDIYEALPADSFLWAVRPPFYKAVTSEKEVLAVVFERATLDDWALALFNTPRDMRAPVEAMFNSKQKFLFMNKMRSIDASNVDRRLLGLAREKIGRIHYEVVKHAKYEQENVDSLLNDTKGSNDDTNKPSAA